MPVARFVRSAGTRRLVARAGACAALALLGACVIPPRPIAPNPEPLPSTPPALSVWTPGVFPGSGGMSSLYFSTDRPGYATVFEVDRRGRVRVVSPRTPREDGRVVPGETYSAAGTGIANDRTFLSMATDWRRLPFLFVVVSDARPDLSDFGSGRAWGQQVRTEGFEAEDVVEAVAQRITARSGRPFATDFAYLGPRLSVGEAMFAASCGVVARDARDYWYYRELWAVFTPADPLLGLTPVFAFGSIVTWASSPYLGIAYDRAQWATVAFRGSCGPSGQQRWAFRNPLFANNRFASWTLASSGTGATAPTPAPTAALPPGAVPVAPRLPKTPREFTGDLVGPPRDPAPRTTGGETTGGQAGGWLVSGLRRPGPVASEPLDRPAPVGLGSDAAGRRWGTPSGWTTGAVGGDVDDRVVRGLRRVDAPPSPGEAGRRSGESGDAAAAPRATPPLREPSSTPRVEGGVAPSGGGEGSGGTRAPGAGIPLRPTSEPSHPVRGGSPGSEPTP